MPPLVDLTGKKIGRLTALSRAYNVPNARNAMWNCSCGCIHKEVVTKILREKRYARTHGRSHSPEHRAWSKMKGRCLNPQDKKYYRYGGRGIIVCERWLTDFMNFYNDMGPRPSSRYSVGRIDNDTSISHHAK